MNLANPVFVGSNIRYFQISSIHFAIYLIKSDQYIKDRYMLKNLIILNTYIGAFNDS